MTTKIQPERTRFRLIVTRRRANEILLSSAPAGPSLPQAEVRSGVRPTEQLIPWVRQNYRLETYCLSANGGSASPGVSPSDRHATLEVFDHDEEAPAGTMWILSAAAASDPRLPAADRFAISSSLAVMGRSMAEPSKGPFARPGWIAELFGWVEDALRPTGLRATGKFKQFNAGPAFSLMRIETNERAVWFKATGEPNIHELSIAVALDGLFPGRVPRVLGVHPRWNGWLSEEAPGQTLECFTDPDAWAGVAEALAELQIASVPKTQKLFEAGCRDLRLDRLEPRIDAFLQVTSDLMCLQTKEPPHILNDAELRLLGDCLRAAFSELERNRMPATLGHLDFNPGNILVSPPACCFLDWAEASITHPLFTFEYLREHARRRLPETGAANEALVSAYLRPWQSLVSRETVLRATIYSPLLAVFAYAVAGTKWLSPEPFPNPALGGLFRSLARRAYREATQIALRREPCHA